jgi:transcriptional regulator with XRE-family HTH domain
MNSLSRKVTSRADHFARDNPIDGHADGGAATSATTVRRLFEQRYDSLAPAGRRSGHGTRRWEVTMANRRRREREQIDPAVWKRPDMRAALAARDISAVFRLLQRMGVSQRHIAALTGQAQSEISEILAGRQVVSYDVLARIADGLGVPRGCLGLAYDDETAALLGLSQPVGPPVSADPPPEDPAQLLTYVTELALGSTPVDPQSWTLPFRLTASRPPDRIALSDVERLAAITEQLRAADRQFGGGSCRDAVLAQLTWASQLLRARADQPTTEALHRAVADLHLLAGWASFDLGVLGEARRHFARALEHARFVNEASLAAKAMYCMGRLHLHHGWNVQALRLFQVGQVAAQESGHGRAVAMLHINLAWAHAVLGDARQALACIGRARDEYGRCEHESAPPWLAFFDSAELQALRGITLAHLPDPTPQQRAEAIERFSFSTAVRGEPFARSRTFDLIALAWLLIDSGEVEHGLRVGHEALDAAGTIRSRRVIDRMAALRASLARRRSHPDARDLANRIATLRP